MAMAEEEEVKELAEFLIHNYDLEEQADMEDFVCLSAAALQKEFSMTFYKKAMQRNSFYQSFWILKLGVPKGKKVSEKDNGKRLLIISLRNKLRLFNDL